MFKRFFTSSTSDVLIFSYFMSQLSFPRSWKDCFFYWIVLKKKVYFDNRYLCFELYNRGQQVVEIGPGKAWPLAHSAAGRCRTAWASSRRPCSPAQTIGRSPPKQLLELTNWQEICSKLIEITLGGNPIRSNFIFGNLFAKFCFVFDLTRSMAK